LIDTSFAVSSLDRRSMGILGKPMRIPTSRSYTRRNLRTISRGLRIIRPKLFDNFDRFKRRIFVFTRGVIPPRNRDLLAATATIRSERQRSFGVQFFSPTKSRTVPRAVRRTLKKKKKKKTFGREKKNIKISDHGFDKSCGRARGRFGTCGNTPGEKDRESCRRERREKSPDTKSNRSPNLRRTAGRGLAHARSHIIVYTHTHTHTRTRAPRKCT